jgi:Terpene cyclase DEP1
MRPKHLYLGLCVIGTLLPYSQFLPFVRENGVDAHAFIEQLFATRIGAFFAWDVIVSSVVLWVMVVVEGRRAGISYRWVPIAANLLVGVSLGLPLFLYLREARRELAV